MIVAYINSFILFSLVFFLIFFSCKSKSNFLSHRVRALSFTMISIGQYNNSSYLKYCLHVNIFVTHDELETSTSFIKTFGKEANLIGLD